MTLMPEHGSIKKQLVSQNKNQSETGAHIIECKVLNENNNKTVIFQSCLYIDKILYQVDSNIIIAGHIKVREAFKSQDTALHQGLSKHLTAQDTCGTPTLTKHNITLTRLGNLLFLQLRSQ